MALETTGALRWFVEVATDHTTGAESKKPAVLQQEWGYRNNWAWSNLHWVTVPTVEGKK